jgi:hypothetical protein
MRILLLFGLIVLSGITAAGQRTTATKIVSDLNLRLNLSSGLFEDVYSKAADYNSINYLMFANSSGSEDVTANLKNFSTQKINTLEFDNISDEDFRNLLDKFYFTKTVNTLIIRNSSIASLPLDFIYRMKIKSLTVENCPSINPVSIATLLYNTGELRRISLRNCKIYSISPSERFYTEYDNGPLNKSQLQTLDLRDNKISEAGFYLAAFESLDSVFLSGNNIPDDSTDLKYLANTKIKYVEADPVSEEVKLMLKKAGKHIDWDFRANVAKPVEDSPANAYGSFSTNSTSFKILSTAYLHYEELFSSPQSNISYDTLSREQIFWDTVNKYGRSYAVLNSINSFKLFKQRTMKRNHITFTFNKIKKTGWFSTELYTRPMFYSKHPEMNVFRKYRWIVFDEMNPREFRKYTSEIYTDLRLKFVPGLNYYEIYLKRADGGINVLKAYPVRGKKAKRMKVEPSRYTGDYSRYMAILSRLSRSHDRTIYRNKQLARTSAERMRRNAWNVLRTYMSAEERKMSEEEWMKYYFKVLKYEDAALSGVYPSETFLLRKFEKAGFTNNYISDTSLTKTVFGYFTDEKGFNIPASSYIIIDKTSMTYTRKYVGSVLFPAVINLPVQADVNIMVFLIDGSVGLVLPDEIKKALSSDPDNVRLRCKIIERELVTIGQIFNEFAL